MSPFLNTRLTLTIDLLRRNVVVERVAPRAPTSEWSRPGAQRATRPAHNSKFRASRHPSILGTLGLALLLPVALLRAENWPNWRGPAFDGSSQEKSLPTEFSKTNQVKWATEMPGPAASTPIVWADHVFASSIDRQGGTLVALGLDRKTGKVLWQKEVGPGTHLDDKSNFASPSPVTDGDQVFFYYGNGELAAFDYAGKKAWARNIQKDYGPFAYQWTYAASPTLYQGRLYIQVLQRNVPVNGRGRPEGPNDSYLLALDPKTGVELWRHVRPADARQESLEAYSTPLPFTHEGRTEILIAGGDCISGHNPATGAELWRWGTWNPTRITHWRLVPSPVGGGGVVLACGPKGAPVCAVKAGASGTLADTALAWKSNGGDISSDVSTPLFYQGRFYVLNSDRKSLSCVEPASGKVLWTGATGSRAKIEASPLGADGKIYVMNFRGDVFVLAAGDEFKVLHTAAMGEDGDNNLRSSIAVSQGHLYIRTGSKLYCIGKG
jgi:outer membrane protein assembly factor BamB